MTDRKIKVAKAIIKQIIKDSENLTILNPEQLKEEILTLETALSRILLNRAVYRYAYPCKRSASENRNGSGVKISWILDMIRKRFFLGR